MTTEPTPENALQPETLAIRSGRSANGSSLAPVLWATSTFVTPTVEEGRKMATAVGAAQVIERQIDQIHQRLNQMSPPNQG